MRSILVFCAVAILMIGQPALAESPTAQGFERPESVEAEKLEKCEHGVKKSICTRCNPKLAAVFKAKGDWCDEHQRAESQCVICHPELEKKGIK